MPSPIVYLELPSTNIAADKPVLRKALRLDLRGFRSGVLHHPQCRYRSGFNATNDGRSKAPLAVIQTDRIEAMERSVAAAGGIITVPTFAFPGGRRFHFTDPSGNELAVMQPG